MNIREGPITRKQFWTLEVLYGTMERNKYLLKGLRFSGIKEQTLNALIRKRLVALSTIDKYAQGGVLVSTTKYYQITEFGVQVLKLARNSKEK